MATVKNTTKGFCDEVFTELSGIKDRIMVMRDRLAVTYSSEKELFNLVDRHIGELVSQIDWKLQILSHACPYDWQGSAEAEYEENTASVGPADMREPDFAGGYLGG